jgi:hypothetical protein
MSTDNEKPPLDVDSFFHDEAERIETDRKAVMAEKGYREFFSLPVGQTTMILHKSVPRITKGDYGERKVFRIHQDGKEYDFAINPRSPIYREVIKRLSATTEKSITLTIVRAGEGKQTRYSIV